MQLGPNGTRICFLFAQRLWFSHTSSKFPIWLISVTHFTEALLVARKTFCFIDIMNSIKSKDI